MMNVKQHANLSYIGDGLEEAHAALAAGSQNQRSSFHLMSQLVGHHEEAMQDYMD